jgi:hypothetical protein
MCDQNLDHIGFIGYTDVSVYAAVALPASSLSTVSATAASGGISSLGGGDKQVGGAAPRGPLDSRDALRVLQIMGSNPE